MRKFLLQHYPSGGPLSDYIEDLIISGFLERDRTWSLQTGVESKLGKFRIRDNYVRYYLKYIQPHMQKIKKGLFKTLSPFNLPGWERVMGLQFENLILNNREVIWQMLGLRPEDIVFENPYFQNKTSKQQGFQIDYAIQTRFKNIYLCEIKFSQNPISINVIKEIEKKIKALKIPKGFAILPVLIHINGISHTFEKGNYEDYIVLA